MSSLLLALALQAAAADPGIIVSGQLESAYAECVAGKCSPIRDAQVSIAWAEARFQKGRYLEAKRGLQAAVSRNRGKAASEPKPVAALYEATATVAIHDGDKALYREAVAGRVRTLRDNLPASDPDVRAADLALGDMWVKLSNWQQAELAFKQAQRAAEAQGDTAAAISAAIRQAYVAAKQNEWNRAESILNEVSASEGARDPAVQRSIAVARLQLVARQGDDAAVQVHTEKISREPGAEPILYAAKPAPESASSVAERTAGFEEPFLSKFGASSEAKGGKWADIGFWIRPDGRAEDIQVLRGSRALDWTDEMVQQIGSRRYAGIPTDAGETGVYRIERYTLRASYRTPVGSLIARRAGPEQLEMAVLTSPGVRVIGTE